MEGMGIMDLFGGSWVNGEDGSNRLDGQSEPIKPKLPIVPIYSHQKESFAIIRVVLGLRVTFLN